MRHRIRRFFQTPKGLLTVILAALVAMAAPGQGRAAAAGLVAAIGSAAAVDVLILRWWKRRWEYPSGAVLTAAIVAMVLRAHEPWYVTAATALIAIAGKWAFRAGGANVFNDVYAIVVTNKSATAVFVDFKDATAGTTRLTLAAPASDTRGFTVPVDSAMVQAVAANNWTATVSSAVTSIEITMLYVANL